VRLAAKKILARNVKKSDERRSGGN